MQRGNSLNRLVAVLLLICAATLAGCNWGYTTWNDKSISVSGGTGGMEISTSTESAKIVLGRQVIIFKEHSVILNGVQRPVKAYKKAAVTELAGSVEIRLDGLRIF